MNQFKLITTLLVLIFCVAQVNGQNNRDYKVLDKFEHLRILKSTQTDTLEVDLNLQIGQVLDSTANIGNCSNATTYNEISEFPEGINYLTNQVLIIDGNIIKSDYTISVSSSISAGTYTGEVKFTVYQGTTRCLDRLIIYNSNITPIRFYT